MLGSGNGRVRSVVWEAPRAPQYRRASAEHSHTGGAQELFPGKAAPWEAGNRFLAHRVHEKKFVLYLQQNYLEDFFFLS